MKKVPLSDFALSLNELHSISGLSWSQISRIFGVSERTARCWALGYLTSPPLHSKRLHSILQQVVALNTESPLEARTAILSERGNDSSIFQEWLDERRVNSAIIQYGTFGIFRDSLLEDD